MSVRDLPLTGADKPATRSLASWARSAESQVAPPLVRSSDAAISVLPAGAYDRVPTAFGTWLQRTMGWICMQPFAGLLVFLFRFVGRYDIPNLRALRAEFKTIVRDHRPLLICLNHLTFIDSALVIWALGSNSWYQFHYSKMSWNLPAGDFFKKRLGHRIVAYLAKCLYIHRDGTKRHKNAVMELCKKLLLQGEVVTIFPEGKRSRSGRFEPDKLTFGAGKICSEVPGIRVLCVYIRGDRQGLHSNYPAKGSQFHVATRLIEPKTEREGREAVQDLTGQIAREIQAMEQSYFASRPPSSGARSS